MSWPRGNTGHPAGKGKEPIDVLDLTLSDSPSPEPPPSRWQPPPARSPKSAPRRTPAFPTPHVKKEAPRPMKTEKMSASRQAPGARRAPPKARISPNDIERIIATSDPRAVARVLSDLCKLSPALTGAVARGLAQHSTFAQTLITRYTRRQAGPSRVKPELALPPGSPDSLDDSPSLVGSPQINILSDSEPDDNSGASKSGRTQEKQSQSRPLSAPRVETFARPLPIHQPVARPNAPFQPQSSPSPSVKNEQNRSSSQSVKQCTRCQRNFNDNEIDICAYHPGRKQVVGDIIGKTTRYTCCKQEVDEPGCVAEAGHAAPVVGPLPSLKRPVSYILDPFNIDRSKSPKLH